MGRDIPTRKKKDFNAIWFDEPNKYEYLRESTYMCANSNYRLGGKKEFERYGFKQIGMEKPVRIENSKRSDYHTFIGKYWWLKPYDRGMPDYPDDGKEIRGDPCKSIYQKTPGFYPAEAVKFIE